MHAMLVALTPHTGAPGVLLLDAPQYCVPLLVEVGVFLLVIGCQAFRVDLCTLAYKSYSW
jgi:hypothetical protein